MIIKEECQYCGAPTEIANVADALAADEHGVHTIFVVKVRCAIGHGYTEFIDPREDESTDDEEPEEPDLA